MKVFIEEQKFTKPIVLMALSLAFIGIVISNTKDLEKISQGSFNDKIVELIGIIIIILVAILFANLKLKTRIDEKGIYYKYFPFHLSYKIITWESISKCYMRKYDGISEFGGWGIKFSFRKNKGKSFTTKGNIGLQIELKNGKKILIGTQKKEELERVLKTYQHKITTFTT
jgi:hypothetical protein